MAYLKGWKYVAFISAFVGSIGFATYPIIIYPMTHVDDYSKFEYYYINHVGILLYIIESLKKHF